MSFDISVDISVNSRPHCISVYIAFSLVTNHTKKIGKNTEIVNVLFKNTTVEFVLDQMHEKLNPLAVLSVLFNPLTPGDSWKIRTFGHFLVSYNLN